MNLGMSDWQWWLRWHIGGRLLAWAVYRIMPKSQAQAELADALGVWSARWRDAAKVRESVERWRAE